METLRRAFVVTAFAALALTSCAAPPVVEVVQQVSPTPAARSTVTVPAAAPASTGVAQPSEAAPAGTDVTLATLKTAEVPANCQLPAQRLVNGKTTKGSPGTGELMLDRGMYAFVDLAGLGYKQALVAYQCNAGGVGWPQRLLLIGDGGKLLANYDLGTAYQAEHANVDTMTGGNPVVVRWLAYEGAGTDVVHTTSSVAFADGKLRVTEAEPSYVKLQNTADFVSPTGRLLCHLGPDGATCAATPGAMKKAPPASEVCPSGGTPNAIGVTSSASWSCASGQVADPTERTDLYAMVDWPYRYGRWQVLPDSGFSTKVAVLPYGRTLVAGTYRCSMATSGVTCKNTATGASFVLNQAGVTLKN